VQNRCHSHGRSLFQWLFRETTTWLDLNRQCNCSSFRVKVDGNKMGGGASTSEMVLNCKIIGNQLIVT